MNRPTTRRKARGLLRSLLFIASLTTATAAWAGKDHLEVSVSDILPQHVSLTSQSAPLAEGDFSSDASIVLRYDYVAHAFPDGTASFGSFALGQRLVDNSAQPGSDSNYPVTVAAGQNGTGQHLRVEVTPGNQQRNGPGDFAPASVAITTNCSAANPCPTDDGSEIEANLQFSQGSQVNTSVKIKVVVKLVHPTECVRFYNFLTDQDMTTVVDSTEVGVIKNGRNAGKVTATNPFGQFSDNVLVVNTCATEQNFDLDINLDPAFATNPNPTGNPGNAVFTYRGGVNVDPDTFNIDEFSMGTPHGQLLCLNNVALGANESFLATVHMGTRRDLHVNDLPADGFLFTAAMLEPNLACAGAELAIQAATMSYTIK